ncbi:murein biosynthesis integral membrane protein MurJ [Micropruina sonneratiae]|uniref:murein biosynthesis integral membrane protein MurJ n=1 Tax=Micropruina sonneratiae TaxID=2986940 RepID=UPI0022267A07|nr:murein biosynthesis integral membrane protein MurJ [Micropruina sp. KQZ13P-5]MCW3159402.1 murein biosynthesis integral membrane protein MurJ [Micropruina sp. KQZ13P-5]
MSDEGREAPATGGRRLLNATAVMASGTMVSRILGFGRAILLAFALGNSTRQAEMFGLATLIPNTLYMLFAGGALNTVLVPQIVRAIKNDSDGGQIYVNRIMTAFLAALAAVTVVMVAAVPWLLTLWTDPQWQSLPHWQSLLYITYLTMPQLFFYGAFFLIGQVLNAKDSFGPMMWAPIANNIVQIAILVLYAVIWGQGLDTSAPFTNEQALLLGGGSTLGIVVQTLILIPYYRRTGFQYRPRWDLKGTGLGHTFHLAKWMMGYVALTLVAQAVVTRLATSAVVGGSGAGSTAYNQAYLIWVLPHSLLTVSLATAMLPQASRLAAVKDLVGVADEVARAIRLAVTFLVPAAIGLIVLADPIAEVAFSHGQGASGYHFVAWTLMAFAIGLVPYTIQYLYLRGFYALEDTRTPFLLQVVISGLNTVLAVALVLAWDDVNTVAPRLALSYSISYLVGVWLSHRSLRKRLDGLDGSGLILHLAKLTAATVPGAALAWAITWWFSRFTSTLLILIGLGLAGVVALLTFFFAAKRLGIAESTQVLQALRRRREESVVSQQADELAEEIGNGPIVGPADDSDRSPASPRTPAEHAEEVNDDPDGAGRFVPIAAARPVDAPLLHYPDPEDGHLPAMEVPTDAEVPAVVVGQVLGERYRLDEVLARRGSALTWRAFDQRLSRPVLMHLLPPDDARGPELIGVAKRASGAPDSAFLRVLDAGSFDEGEHYIVYEYAPGTSIQRVLAAGPLSPVESAWVVKELAQALSALHSRGLYHERVNPDTVVITAAGNVRIVGLLVEAALDPTPQPLADEAADVRALGALLYACLVTRWPGGDAYGLTAAPTDGARTLTPAQVKAGVPRMLDTLCDRILNPTPRNRQTPITTARAVAQQLSAVLGQASAAPDLERRLRMPVEQFRTAKPQTPAAGGGPRFSSPVPPPLPRPLGPDDDPSADGDDDWDATGESTQPWQLPGLKADDPTTEPFTPIPPPATSAGQAQLMVPGARRGGMGRPPRRFMAVVIGVFGLLLALGLVWVAVSQLNARRADPVPSADQTAAQVIAVVSATDFDPSADGGSNAENPRLTPRAIDNDPDSAWLTERYRGKPEQGGLKPGIGLVLDLGAVKRVSQVNVTLLGNGTDIELRLPADPDVTRAPMRSQADWTVAASVEQATGTAVMKLDEPATTRFLLVYLTSLPPESGSYYQGGISNIEVRG